VSADEDVPAVGQGLADAYGPDLARAALNAAKARAALNASEQERMEAAGRRSARRREQRDRKTRAKGDPLLFGAAIEKLLAARGWQADVRSAGVTARWPEIVGTEIAARCRPVSLTDGELVLEAESTAWATQLRLMARQIAERVDVELGAGTVKKVRVHGPASARGPESSGILRVRGSRGPRDTYG